MELNQRHKDAISIINMILAQFEPEERLLITSKLNDEHNAKTDEVIELHG